MQRQEAMAKSMDGHKNITYSYSDYSNKTFSINEFTYLQC